MGRFVDAEEDGLGASRFITFEIEKLMAQGERVLLPVLTYLFHRIDQRLDGRPTIVVLDEAWVMLMNGTFGAKVEEWLRTLRKKNAAVILATQSVTEVANSSLRDLILESCPTKIYLPNAEARSPATAELYRKFGLTERRDRIGRRRHAQAPVLLRVCGLPSAVVAPAHSARSCVCRRGIARGDRTRQEASSRARPAAGLRGGFARAGSQTGRATSRSLQAAEGREFGAKQHPPSDRSTEQSRRWCNESMRVFQSRCTGAVGAACVCPRDRWSGPAGLGAVRRDANRFRSEMFARQLNQLQQETAAVQNLAAQLQNAVQNTTAGGGAGLWRSNQGLLTNLGNIVAEQQGLSYTLSNLSSEFQRMFPGYVASQSGNVAPQAAQGFTSTLNTLNGTAPGRGGSGAELSSRAGDAHGA